jgi:hypothetical protein
MKFVPTVRSDELTDIVTFAAPVTSRATVGAVLFNPTLLLTESTNNVPESILTLPATVCNDPFSVAFPDNVVVPDTVICPLKLPVFALTIQRLAEVPNSDPTVLLDGYTPELLADTIPDTVELLDVNEEAFIVPV